MTQCSYKKTDGKQCRRYINNKLCHNSQFCWQHQKCQKVKTAIFQKKPEKTTKFLPQYHFTRKIIHKQHKHIEIEPYISKQAQIVRLISKFYEPKQQLTCYDLLKYWILEIIQCYEMIKWILINLYNGPKLFILSDKSLEEWQYLFQNFANYGEEGFHIFYNSLFSLLNLFTAESKNLLHKYKQNVNAIVLDMINDLKIELEYSYFLSKRRNKPIVNAFNYSRMLSMCKQKLKLANSISNLTFYDSPQFISELGKISELAENTFSSIRTYCSQTQSNHSDGMVNHRIEQIKEEIRIPKSIKMAEKNKNLIGELNSLIKSHNYDVKIYPISIGNKVVESLHDLMQIIKSDRTDIKLETEIAFIRCSQKTITLMKKNLKRLIIDLTNHQILTLGCLTNLAVMNHTLKNNPK